MYLQLAPSEVAVTLDNFMLQGLKVNYAKNYVIIASIVVGLYLNDLR
jgi:hypothetical protein